MADGIQAFADVLGGFGAGVSGNLIPFQEQQERKDSAQPFLSRRLESQTLNDKRRY